MLLIPIPGRWTRQAARLAFWRRDPVNKRMKRRRVLRVLIGAYLAVVTITVLVLVVWILPWWLTEYPHVSSPVDRHRAVTDTRTGLVAMLAAIGAAGGLAYTARTYRLSREGQRTDRYSKAVEQLGDEKVEVRLGGIYALERLMRDSRADQPTIMETLTAFVRQHSPRSPGQDLLARSSPPSKPRRPPVDVQAVLAGLGPRNPVDDEHHIDLRDTDLAGVLLPEEAPLADAEFDGANLTRAEFPGADLTGAHFMGAILIEANFDGATLDHADLSDATVTDGSLTDEQLKTAEIKGMTKVPPTAPALSSSRSARAVP